MSSGKQIKDLLDLTQHKAQCWHIYTHIFPS